MFLEGTVQFKPDSARFLGRYQALSARLRGYYKWLAERINKGFLHRYRIADLSIRTLSRSILPVAASDPPVICQIGIYHAHYVPIFSALVFGAVLLSLILITTKSQPLLSRCNPLEIPGDFSIQSNDSRRQSRGRARHRCTPRPGHVRHLDRQGEISVQESTSAA